MHACSALARAGKSVLLLDSTESYGGSWASLSGPDYVHGLINRQLEHQLFLQQQQEQQQEQQQGAARPDEDGSSSAACRVMLRAVQPLEGASGVSLYTHPDVEQALENKQLLMDLAPKVRRCMCIAMRVVVAGQGTRWAVDECMCAMELHVCSKASCLHADEQLEVVI
jgi:RAB protein geranylgeranyltransferase component A